MNGSLQAYCDCAKGAKTHVQAECIHIQFVQSYSEDFGEPLYDNEEPLAFLISDNGEKSHFFSITSQSGSLRHRTAKRVIVYFKYSK